MSGPGAAEGVDLGSVELLRMEVSAHCRCGEPLDRGEHAGFDAARRELFCLWCLADLKAGRPRPRRRVDRPAVPERLPTPVAPAASHAAHGPATSVARRGPRRSRPGGVLTPVLAIAMIGAGLLARPHLLPAESVTPPAGDGSISARVADIVMGPPITPAAPSGPSSAWPPVPADAQPTPLGQPPAARSSSTAYRFMTTTPSGAPVTFDPCRPIRLVVNTSQAPRGADELVREATAALSHATGLVFMIEGQTTEPPTSRRPAVDRARYGNRWSPVLLAWTDETAVPELAGRIAGLGGPRMAPYSRESEMHFVSGVVYLDGDSFAELSQRRDGRAQARAIIMHELAHLVGLTHVDDSRELMFSDNTGQTTFGPGDLEGLRRLGGGPCFSD